MDEQRDGDHDRNNTCIFEAEMTLLVLRANPDRRVM